MLRLTPAEGFGTRHRPQLLPGGGKITGRGAPAMPIQKARALIGEEPRLQGAFEFNLDHLSVPLRQIFA